MDDVVLEMNHISKLFSGVRALDDVSIKVHRGEIHALCGENGAGKSTLMKILSGVYPHGTFEGEIKVDGKAVEFRNIKGSETKGISIIHQELNLVPEFSIAENIFLGREIADRGIISFTDMYRESKKWMDLVGLKSPPEKKIKYLGIGEQQMVEIAKALKNQAKILILDEPTAALAETEVETLLSILRNIQKQGVTCIYISHKLREVLSISQSVTILRDGKVIGTDVVSELNEARIISMMVGRNLENQFPKVVSEVGDVVLELENWSVVARDTGKYIVNNASFQVRAGEVLGIAGLVGAGRTELVTSLFGAMPGKLTGELKISGKRVRVRSPESSIRNGMALVTEDRKRYGLVLGMGARQNLTLAHLSLDRKRHVINGIKDRILASRMISDLRIKVPSLESEVRQLSGGNQQKVVIGKWLMTEPKVLILDEPTRGIDVGAKFEIYQLINQLTATGLAVILISSELPEVLGMSDRVLVMAGGSIRGELSRAEATEENIMQLATGGH